MHPQLSPFVRALFLSAVLGSVGWAAETSESPENFAERFYTTLLKQKPLGLPNDKQWRTLRPFFTPDLVAGMETAKKVEAAEAKKHPDEPPAYGDGWIFCSLYEGPSTFRVGKAVPGQNETRVPVSLSYRSGNEHTQWVDTLILAPSGGSWRVREVEFGGKWAFKSGHGLRQAIGLKK